MRVVDKDKINQHLLIVTFCVVFGGSALGLVNFFNRPEDIRKIDLVLEGAVKGQTIADSSANSLTVSENENSYRVYLMIAIFVAFLGLLADAAWLVSQRNKKIRKQGVRR